MEKFILEPRYTPVDFDPFVGSPIVRAIPTTEAQREVLTASEMGDEASCAYNESVSLELKGNLDQAALDKAMLALIARHESLRATLNASGTRMLISDGVPFNLPFTDLSDLKEKEWNERLATIAKKDMLLPFDLRNGPVFRAQLIKVAADLHLLRLTGHHVVCDGWSLGIMMAEISALYPAPWPRIAGSARSLATASCTCCEKWRNTQATGSKYLQRIQPGHDRLRQELGTPHGRTLLARSVQRTCASA
ncbi:MAG TPA: condensation domain-containing protein [Flavobacteriales bacterium]|nr:condensation domain-containing protein [Flavobacteriales bacterium]